MDFLPGFSQVSSLFLPHWRDEKLKYPQGPGHENEWYRYFHIKHVTYWTFICIATPLFIDKEQCFLLPEITIWAQFSHIFPFWKKYVEILLEGSKIGRCGNQLAGYCCDLRGRGCFLEKENMDFYVTFLNSFIFWWMIQFPFFFIYYSGKIRNVGRPHVAIGCQFAISPWAVVSVFMVLPALLGSWFPHLLLRSEKAQHPSS